MVCEHLVKVLWAFGKRVVPFYSKGSTFLLKRYYPLGKKVVGNKQKGSMLLAFVRRAIGDKAMSGCDSRALRKILKSYLLSLLLSNQKSFHSISAVEGLILERRLLRWRRAVCRFISNWLRRVSLRSSPQSLATH